MAKLSKGNRDTLDLLKGRLPDAVFGQLEKAILEAKSAATSRERKPREVSFEFTPRDAQIFTMRVIDGKSQPEIEKELNVETSVVNAALRGISWKLINLLTTGTPATENEEAVDPIVSHATLSEVLNTHATAAERKPKDKVVKEEAPAAESADTTSATPDEVAAALAGD